MKRPKILLLIITACMAVVMVLNAQNYKAPAIDASGKVTDDRGKYIGMVSMEGIITDSAGIKIGMIDNEGSLVDTKTGTKMGKSEKNGNFTTSYAKTKDDKWTISEPMNGNCKVTDRNNKTVVIVHENYKQYGACVYYCLSIKKMNKGMKM